ncbi:MAG: hypothetical protein IJL87_08475 [Clostridia bacterium]|nr:hypothetical protein [Clostridia bacterium]
MDSPDMQRISLYLPKKLIERADRTKEECGFASRNDFFARAVDNFIADQLLSDEEISSALNEKLSRAVHALSEDNSKAISKGLFRYAVQLEIVVQILSQLSDFDDSEIDDMRRKAINNVRRTRGKISLEEIMRGYYNEK